MNSRLLCDESAIASDVEDVADANAAQRKSRGLYLIAGVNNPISGYRRVAGTQATTCTPDGECRGCLRIFSTTPETSDSTAADTTADLEEYDRDIFRTSGVTKLAPVKVGASHAASFIRLVDEEVIGSVNLEWGLRGINVCSLKNIETTITVISPDGTKAIYVKCSNTTDQWHWAGFAWGTYSTWASCS